MNEIEKLMASVEKSVRDAFLAAVADIKSEAQLTLLISALERGDVQAALDVLNLRAEMFQPLDEALRNAYIQGGVAALAALPVIPDPFPQGVWLSALMADIHLRKGG